MAGIEFDRTSIPLAFRRARVCVCLYGFAFELSLSLFVGRGACPSRCIEPLNPRNHYKRTIILSPRTNTLASLVKGRWIDGKPQVLILLLSVCDTPAFFTHQTFLPSRRRDCLTIISSLCTNHPKNRTIRQKELSVACYRMQS